MHCAQVGTMEEALERLLLMNLEQQEWFSLRMCVQQLSDAGFAPELVRAKVAELASRGELKLIVGHRRHGGNWDVILLPPHVETPSGENGAAEREPAVAVAVAGR
jgi:hypothetical protein